MARFSFALWDQTAETMLAGQVVAIKNAGGTLVAHTFPPGAEKQIINNGDGTYYVDDIAAALLTVYVGAGVVQQQELTSIPWDNGASTTHGDLTTAHGATADLMGQDEVDDSSIEYSGGLRVKALGIVEAMIGALAVTTAKIANLAITAGKLATDAVETAKIKDLNVTGAKLAAAVAGDGLKKDGSGNLEVEVSTVAEELDLAINSAGQLKLLKTFPQGAYLDNEMTFDQLMTVIDNRLRQNIDNVAGKTHSILYNQTYYVADSVAGTAYSLTYTTNQIDTATYVYSLMVPFLKTPEMRQLVISFYGGVSGGTGYAKVFCGGLSQESDAITNNTSYEPKRLYLDITSLTNWSLQKVDLAFKVSAGDLFTQSIEVAVRSDITALSGETSYAQDNPVE